MSFTNNKLDLTILSKVLTNLEPISEAPGGPPLIKDAKTLAEQRKKVDDAYSAFMSREEGKLYKAIDSKNGDIYVVTNPACRSYYKDAEGRTFLNSGYKKLEMTYAEALIAAQMDTASSRRADRF